MKTLFRFLALLSLMVFCPLAHAVDDFVATGSMNDARQRHTATLLANGKVLVVGNLSSVELYDPATGLWSATGSIATGRVWHTATLLANGKVLVTGGYDNNGNLSSAELYDPATGLWSTTGSLTTARWLHMATLLANGKVLVAGGRGSGSGYPYLSSAELYDPATGQWSVIGSMATARAESTAVLLTNGKVLVAGGYGNGTPSSAELYDPATGLWSATGSLAIGRYAHTATLLANGKLLFTGGYNNNNVALTSAELYDPATELWSTTGSLATARYRHTAALLANGKLLVAGGDNGSNIINTAELYDPETRQWSTAGSLTNARSSHTATSLVDGKVLIAGGYNGNSLSSAELYTAAPLAWSLFSAAESALAVADVGLVNLSPIDKLSVVTGEASHSGSGNALKFQTVDNGSTFAERTIVGPAVVDFWWRVSSEEGADFFSFRVDGTLQQSISGNGSWVNRSLTLGAGTHTLRWTYAKDVDSANFEDAGYLDDLVILPAYTDLQVSRLGTVLSGSSTLDFSTVQQDAAVLMQELDLKNNGTVPMDVAASLPAGCGFVFDTDESSIVFTLGAGEEVILWVVMQTAVPGAKSALLAIEGTDSQTVAPAITLNGHVQAIAPILGCSWSGGALINGQSTAVDFGTTPNDIAITVGNTGSAPLVIASLSVSPTTDFQVIAQPASSVAINGSTSFTLRALEGSRGSHAATVTIVSDDPNTPSFSFPVTSQSYLAATGTSFVSGSFTNTGTSAGWSNATVTLPSGSSGQALKTGSTPDNGDSTIGATFDGPGLLSWNWQVSSQANYDWLLCEVNGVEVAGISVKTAAWQSQVVQIPAGASVRWIYRKDGSNLSGSDTGYLSDIYFSKFTAAQSSFQDWSLAHGDLAPTQLIPAGGM